MLGVLGELPDEWLAKDDEGGLSSDAIDQLLVERAEAKSNRDFARADAIRDELNAAGIIIEDGAAGATWRRA